MLNNKQIYHFDIEYTWRGVKSFEINAESLDMARAILEEIPVDPRRDHIHWEMFPEEMDIMHTGNEEGE
jgi:hypothetical protein